MKFPSWTLDDLTRAYVARVLRACRGNLSAAARRLGLHRRTLQRKCDKLGLTRSGAGGRPRNGGCDAVEGSPL